MDSDSSNIIHVLIVEDAEAMATGLAAFFERLTNVEAVAIVTDGNQAYEFLKNKTCEVDIVLMDIAIKSDSESGIIYTKRLKRIYPKLHFIAYSAFGNSQIVKKFFDAGGVGFLDKIDSLDEVVDGIERVYKGERYTSKNVQEYSGNFNKSSKEKSNTQLLIPKLLEVLRLRADGMTNKEIAQHLYLSEETIKSHTKKIIRKLQANNMSNAIYLATKLELI